jgi:hypothetical protein
MLLSGQILELGDPGVEVVVRVIDDRDRLRDRYFQCFPLKLQGSIWQFAKAIVEVFVDGTGGNDFVVQDAAFDLAIVGFQQNLDLGMIQHPFEHPGVAA